MGESRKTGPWLADNQSRDLDYNFWLVVYLIRLVAAYLASNRGIHVELFEMFSGIF